MHEPTILLGYEERNAHIVGSPNVAAARLQCFHHDPPVPQSPAHAPETTFLEHRRRIRGIGVTGPEDEDHWRSASRQVHSLTEVGNSPREDVTFPVPESSSSLSLIPSL